MSLSSDPTRTKTLRRRFRTEMRLRLDRVVAQLQGLLVERDVLQGQWSFFDTAQKLEAFRSWLYTQLETFLLSSPTTQRDDWWETYLSTAYYAGSRSSYTEVRGHKLLTLEAVSAGRAEFLRSLSAKETIRALSARFYTEIQGLADTIAQQCVRELADALQGVTTNAPTAPERRGPSAAFVLSKMTERIDAVRPRADAIVETETTRAHADGQLDAYDALGVGELEVVVEWTTARTPCPLCSAMSGVRLKPSEARGMIPRHPRCKCKFRTVRVPKKPRRGRPKKKHTAEGIREARETSLQAERPKKALSTARKRSRWAGKSNRITKGRRR